MESFAGKSSIVMSAQNNGQLSGDYNHGDNVFLNISVHLFVLVSSLFVGASVVQ